MTGVPSATTGSAGTVYREPVSASGSTESAPPRDTLADGSTRAAAEKWTPPCGLTRYCIYVKHRIADFMDWVCSLFCGSRAATEEQIEDAFQELQAFNQKANIEELANKRYEGLKASSKNDVYVYLADYIESLEPRVKIQCMMGRREEYKMNLNAKQNLKSGVLLTERQLRAEVRQQREMATSIAILLHSDLPKEATSAMRDKVEAYSLGKLMFTKSGKVVSLVDFAIALEIPRIKELEDAADKLVEEIRAPALKKLTRQVPALADSVVACYQKVTLQDLAEESQVVHLLAHVIEMVKRYEAATKEEGDISQEAVNKRIDTLKKWLAQPALGKATSKMRKTVKECNESTPSTILSRIMLGWSEAIRGRVLDVADAVQKAT